MSAIEGPPSIGVAELEKATQAYRHRKLKRIAAGLAVQLHCHDTIVDDRAVVRSAKALLEWLEHDEEPNGHNAIPTVAGLTRPIP